LLSKKYIFLKKIQHLAAITFPISKDKKITTSTTYNTTTSK